MRECIFHLPVSDNAGRPLRDVHAMVRHHLSDLFGGFTAHEAVGGWLDGDTVQVEPVVRYIVATEKECEFEAFAYKACRMGRQKACYIVIDGHARIVSVAAFQAA